MVMCETYKYNKEPTETNHRKVVYIYLIAPHYVHSKDLDYILLLVLKFIVIATLMHFIISD